MALNITINKTTVAASYPAGSTVATAVASGGTTPYTYSLATGGDYFSIDASTGVVTTKALMDASSIQSFSVTATDSNSTPESITSGVVYPNIQAAQQSKFNKSNVIYKITKDIDLGNAVLTIPAGCTLDFQGGSINNGVLILMRENTMLLNGATLTDCEIELGKSDIFGQLYTIENGFLKISDNKTAIKAISIGDKNSIYKQDIKLTNIVITGPMTERSDKTIEECTSKAIVIQQAWVIDINKVRITNVDIGLEIAGNNIKFNGSNIRIANYGVIAHSGTNIILDGSDVEITTYNTYIDGEAEVTINNTYLEASDAYRSIVLKAGKLSIMNCTIGDVYVSVSGNDVTLTAINNTIQTFNGGSLIRPFIECDNIYTGIKLLLLKNTIQKSFGDSTKSSPIITFKPTNFEGLKLTCRINTGYQEITDWEGVIIEDRVAINSSSDPWQGNITSLSYIFGKNEDYQYLGEEVTFGKELRLKSADKNDPTINGGDYVGGTLIQAIGASNRPNLYYNKTSNDGLTALDVAYGNSSQKFTYNAQVKSAFYNNIELNFLEWWNGKLWNKVLTTANYNTANRPTLNADQYGTIIYDTTLNKYILWNGTAWVNLDGTALA